MGFVTAVKTLTAQQSPAEERPIEEFLSGDVYTNPQFKKNRKDAEKLLALRYDEAEDENKVVKRSIMGDVRTHERWIV